MITEIFPIIQPIIRLLPRRFSVFKQEVGRLIDLERKLWISLLDTAKLRIKEGKANQCQYALEETEIEDRISTDIPKLEQLSLRIC
jgi:hypothetical protein